MKIRTTIEILCRILALIPPTAAYAVNPKICPKMAEMVMSALPEEFEDIKANICKNMCLPQL